MSENTEKIVNALKESGVTAPIEVTSEDNDWTTISVLGIDADFWLRDLRQDLADMRPELEIPEDATEAWLITNIFYAYVAEHAMMLVRCLGEIANFNTVFTDNKENANLLENDGDKRLAEGFTKAIARKLFAEVGDGKQE